MTRLYRYILVTDSGMAPCLDDDLLTLATCKPRIRAKAKVGDWIAGFCPISSDPVRAQPRGRLAYVGRVRERLSVGDYERQFGARADAVYREQPDGSFWRKHPTYHDDPDAIRKDLSAGVLVLDPNASWYFGGSPVQVPDEFLSLAAEGIGHRVHGASEVEIERLVSWLRERSPPGRYGEPRHAGTITHGKRGCGPSASFTQPRTVQSSKLRAAISAL